MSRLRRGWTPPAVIYLLLAVAGLVGTWTYNVRAVLESELPGPKGSNRLAMPVVADAT